MFKMVSIFARIGMLILPNVTNPRFISMLSHTFLQSFFCLQYFEILLCFILNQFSILYQSIIKYRLQLLALLHLFPFYFLLFIFDYIYIYNYRFSKKRKRVIIFCNAFGRAHPILWEVLHKETNV